MPRPEKPENIVVHGQDDHQFEVGELEEKELDEAAGGFIDKTSSDPSKPKSTRYIDKSSPDLM